MRNDGIFDLLLALQGYQIKERLRGLFKHEHSIFK